MKSVLVIGIGKFGKILATRLMEMGNDVMIVDQNEDIINELAPKFTNALIANCTLPTVLKNLGITNFDICFVTIGEDFQSSLEITSQLKEMGAKYVISKATTDLQAKFLLRNGADEIVYPEKDMAEKFAVKTNTENVTDYIELTNEYGIFEIALPKKWKNHTLKDLNLRQKHNINVLALKRNNVLDPVVNPEYIFCGDEHVVVLGRPDDVFHL